MDLDVVMLSRVQFALTIMFHYLFPPLPCVLIYTFVVYWTFRGKVRLGEHSY